MRCIAHYVSNPCQTSTFCYCCGSGWTTNQRRLHGQSLLQANAHVSGWTHADARKSLMVVCGVLSFWWLHLVRVIHTSTTRDHCFRDLSFKSVSAKASTIAQNWMLSVFDPSVNDVFDLALSLRVGLV